MQPQDWPTAFVSSTVRAMLKPPALRTVKIFPLLPTPSSEKLFFSAFNELISLSSVTTCDAVHGCCDASHNVIVSSVMQYLLSCFRLEEIETLCARHMADAPGLVHYAAAAEVLRGNVDAACAMAAAAHDSVISTRDASTDANNSLRSCILSTLSSSLRAKFTSCGQGTADTQAVVSAIEKAREAARLCPYNLQAWLTLCKAYAASKDWPSMLITINSIPFHLEKKMGRRGIVTVDGSPVQESSMCTAPSIIPDPSRLNTFDFHHGDADLDYSSVPSELDSFPGSKLEGVSKEVYSLIVEAMNNSSWDELLEIRSCVFLMKDEEKSQTPSNHSIAAAATIESDVIETVASVGGQVDRSGSGTSQPDSVECSTLSQDIVSVTVPNGSLDDSAHGAGAENEDSDPDVWRADMALDAARMLFTEPTSHLAASEADAQPSFALSTANLEAMLHTNKNISSSKLKRLMKKLSAKSSTATAEDVAELLVSLSDGDDDVFRSVMKGYMLHLGVKQTELRDASPAASSVSAVASPDSVVAQAAAPSAALDGAAITNSSASLAASSASEKHLCKPWLDSVFMAIYGDLVAYVFSVHFFPYLS
jgi:hypothetical protein